MAERFEIVEKALLKMLDEKKYASLRDILITMNPSDVAGLFDGLEEKQIPVMFRLLPKEQAAETFVEMEPEAQQLLIQGFSDNELREVLDELYVDDAADLVEEMPANVVRRILTQADPEMRSSINQILRYPENSAGALMTMEYVSLRPDMTVEEHPCCTDDMVDKLRFYAFMMSSDLSFRTRAAATLENLTPSASDNIRVRVLIDAQEATGNITDTAYCQDEHWSTARELALTRLNGRWTVTDDDTDASNFFQGGVADEVPPSRELRQAVEAYFQLRADEMAGQMGDSSCTTNALLADARLFAAQVDWSRVYGAQGRAGQFGCL